MLAALVLFQSIKEESGKRTGSHWSPLQVSLPPSISPLLYSLPFSSFRPLTSVIRILLLLLSSHSCLVSLQKALLPPPRYSSSSPKMLFLPLTVSVPAPETSYCRTYGSGTLGAYTCSSIVQKTGLQYLHCPSSPL